MDRAGRLLAHIEAAHEKPAVWAHDGSDCCSWPAQWVLKEAGIYLPLLPYSGEAQARSLMAQHGGLDALWRQVCGPLLDKTFDPQLGDVAVVRTSRGAAGVIYGNGGLAFVRAERGVGILRPRQDTLILAYTVPAA